MNSICNLTFSNLNLFFLFRFVSPSKANVFRSFEVILNYVLQLELEGTTFHVSNVFGIMFLLMAVFATGFESEVMSRVSHRFKWL